MGRKVVSAVHVHNPETGETRIFNPGDEVPDSYEKFITNPAVYEDAGPAIPMPGSSQASDDVPPEQRSAAVPPEQPANTESQSGGETQEADLESKTVAELQEIAEQRGVAKSGTKADLLERLREAS